MSQAESYPIVDNLFLQHENRFCPSGRFVETVLYDIHRRCGSDGAFQRTANENALRIFHKE